MTRCKRCHRVIKNMVSVVHGYGPTCWKKVPHEIIKELEENEEKVYINVKQ